MAAMTCVEYGCRPEDVDYRGLSAGIIPGSGANLKPEELRL